MEVSTSQAGVCGVSSWRPVEITSAEFGLNCSSPALRVSWNTRSRRSWKSRRASSASSTLMSPRPIRPSVYSLRTERLASMTAYIVGWVSDGSSASLCPRRR